MCFITADILLLITYTACDFC